MPASTIHVDTDTGQARFTARHVAVKDYHDIKNAIGGGGPKPVPSHVSFDVHWHGHGGRHKIRDKKFGFEGIYVTGKATISFTASQDGGVAYSSDPAGQYNPIAEQRGSGSPAVGQERNGTFFR
jgi:hypothetical protein